MQNGLEKIIEEIKENLPDVKVMFEGKVYNCTVRGRLNQFAGVYCELIDIGWEFSWQAIARHITSGKPLIA